MNPPRALTPEQVADVRVLYAANYTTRELAEAYGCSHPTIARAIRRAGGTIRPRGGNVENLTKNKR